MDCYNHQDRLQQQQQQSINSPSIMKPPLYRPRSPPWFDMRVFYVRVSNIEVDGFTPKHLTLNHIPLGLDTILEVNGGKSNVFSECVSIKLRRDRVDRTSEEATFINTDNVRITGSVRFEVYDNDDLLLSGVLELCNGHTTNLSNEKSNGLGKKWNIKCRTHMSTGRSLTKGKQYNSLDVLLPTIEIYVAGCFSGNPIILTKTLHVGLAKKHSRQVTLEPIPEYESSKMEKVYPLESLQDLEYTQYGIQSYEINTGSGELDYIYRRANCEEEEEEDGELTWFNAGVRVGVGIGLGICVGVGLGVGLFMRSYRATTKVFRKRLP